MAKLTSTIDWEVKDGTLIISGTGEMPDYTSSKSKPWSSMASIIKRILIEDGITKIGDYTFYKDFESGSTSSAYYLEYINIPASVVSIGASAFRDCKVKVVVINGSLNTVGTSGLSINTGSVVVDVALIFKGNKPVSGSVPSGSSYLSVVTNGWGGNTNFNCGTNVTWDLDLPTRTLTITSAGGTTVSNNRAFDAFSDVIWKIVIGNELKTISSNSFSKIYNVRKVIIGKDVISINDTFKCLVAEFVPGEKVSVRDSTFPDFNMSKPLIDISGGRVVSGLSDSLHKTTNHQCGTNATWDYDEQTGTLTISGTGATSDVTSGYSLFDALLSSCKKIIIGEGITTIGTKFFYHDLMGNSATVLEISLPTTLTTIKSQAFYDAFVGVDLEIPKNVNRIEDDAFYNSSVKMVSLSILSDNIELGKNIWDFNGSNKTSIVIMNCVPKLIATGNTPFMTGKDALFFGICTVVDSVFTFASKNFNDYKPVLIKRTVGWDVINNRNHIDKTS